MKNGWKNFKWRWLTKSFDTPKIDYGLPDFDLKNNFKNVFISYEQGIGDQNTFPRFYNDLNETNIEIYGHFNTKLMDLMKTSFKHVTFPEKIKRNMVESHIPLGDLPSLFINNFSDVHARSGPYLKVDKKRRDDLKKLLPKK